MKRNLLDSESTDQEEIACLSDPPSESQLVSCKQTITTYLTDYIYIQQFAYLCEVKTVRGKVVGDLRVPHHGCNAALLLFHGLGLVEGTLSIHCHAQLNTMSHSRGVHKLTISLYVVTVMLCL